MPKYKDVLFFVNYSKNSIDGSKEVLKYRNFFAFLSVVFFIISTIITSFTNSIFYLSSLITVYVILMLYKFLQGNREILNLRNYEVNPQSKPSYFIKIKKSYYLLHIFTVLYMFFMVCEFKKQNAFDFKNYFYINPITALFVSGLFIMAYLFIKNAPDLADKSIKPLMINYLYPASYTSLFILFSLNVYTLYHPGFIYILYTLIFLIILILINMVSLSYIKEKNKPFEFKVENPRISSEKLIEITPDGTRIFLNFKNKKSRLISAGFLIYLIIYILLVYKFII